MAPKNKKPNSNPYLAIGGHTMVFVTPYKEVSKNLIYPMDPFSFNEFKRFKEKYDKALDTLGIIHEPTSINCQLSEFGKVNVSLLQKHFAEKDLIKNFEDNDERWEHVFIKLIEVSLVLDNQNASERIAVDNNVTNWAYQNGQLILIDDFPPNMIENGLFHVFTRGRKLQMPVNLLPELYIELKTSSKNLIHFRKTIMDRPALVEKMDKQLNEMHIDFDEKRFQIRLAENITGIQRFFMRTMAELLYG